MEKEGKTPEDSKELKIKEQISAMQDTQPGSSFKSPESSSILIDQSRRDSKFSNHSYPLKLNVSFVGKSTIEEENMGDQPFGIQNTGQTHRKQS